MSRWTSSWLACALVCAACNDPSIESEGIVEIGDVETSQCEDPGRFRAFPFRDAWRAEADVAFDVGTVRSLTIGGRAYDGNFVNRGDVIVTYDGPPGRILVDLRRFTQAPSSETAAEDFGLLSLWAYSSGQTAPQRPAQMAPEDDCLAGAGWQDDCAIRVYYDGQSQAARTGADIRVRLPSEWTGELRIVTEDDDFEDPYFNRGNVCVDGVRGPVDVTLENGQAFVRVPDGVSVSPTCPPDDVAACETWPDGAWSTDCPCIQTGHAFGGVSVSTHGIAAADVTVDLPDGLWSSLRLVNEQSGQDGSDPDLHCEARVDVAGAMVLEGGANDFAWEATMFANLPSDAALTGAGYRVDLTSAGCAPVAATENPEQFECDEDPATSVQRGNLRACEGCLGTTPCTDLLP